MSTQPTPEALRLADELERDKWHVPAVVMQAAADELRRLHALTQGTPATGGEPVGTVVHNTAADAQFAPRAVWPLNNFHDLPLGTKLYTSPQPVREPLSDEQIGALSCRDGLTNVEVPVIQWLVREVEFLHGITGGQT